MIKTKSTKVVSAEPTKVAQANWTSDQVELIKNTVAKGATDDELKLFLYTATRTGLDPLTRQIHFVKRWDSKLQREVGAIQTGIDGYRAIAERTGDLAGIDDAVYEEGETGPEKATVAVYRIVKNIRVPFVASARWNEYAPRGSNKAFMWDKMPYLMLGKVAEALALRKAFPLNLSGLYTQEEMAQSDNTPIVEVPKVEPVIQIDETPTVESLEAVNIKDIKVNIFKNAVAIDPTITKENVHVKIAHLVDLPLVEENFVEIDSRLEVLLDQMTKN